MYFFFFQDSFTRLETSWFQPGVINVMRNSITFEINTSKYTNTPGADADFLLSAFWCTGNQTSLWN